LHYKHTVGSKSLGQLVQMLSVFAFFTTFITNEHSNLSQQLHKPYDHVHGHQWKKVLHQSLSQTQTC